MKRERCTASIEVQTVGNSGESVLSEVEICCDHCDVSRSFVRQGDRDSVLHEIQKETQSTLAPQCRRLIELGIDPACVPQRFFPEVTEL